MPFPASLHVFPCLRQPWNRQLCPRTEIFPALDVFVVVNCTSTASGRVHVISDSAYVWSRGTSRSWPSAAVTWVSFLWKTCELASLSAGIHCQFLWGKGEDIIDRLDTLVHVACDALRYAEGGCKEF